MLALLEDLVRHKTYADTAMLSAVRSSKAASQDEELLKLLHHMNLANRFWLSLFLDRPFAPEEASRAPQTFDAIAARYRETQAEEQDWIASGPDGRRTVRTAFLPEQEFSVEQAVTQVCMHSHAHRAQCAARLRALDGVPPGADFIAWLKDRPAPSWW